MVIIIIQWTVKIVLKISRTTMWKKVNEYITIIMATVGTLKMVIY